MWSRRAREQFLAEEVTGGDGMTCCVMCSKSFPSVMNFTDHFNREHSETSATVASPEDQTHINYYDLKPKLEINENGVKVEREDVSPDQSSIISLSSTHKNDIIIKLEVSPQLIDCKDEAYVDVKKEKHCDTGNVDQADQHGPDTALGQIQTGAAPPQETMKTEKDTKGYNEDKMITLQASMNPPLEIRDELTEEGHLATNQIHEIKRCSMKYISEGTAKQSATGYNRNYNNEQTSSSSEGVKNTSEKRLACEMCDYKCNVISRLKTHIRIHTGEKPFACKMCDYKCSVNSSLRQHIFTHTGEKPFACNMCDYKCRKNGSLEKHFRVHTGEKPYGCEMCDYRCSDKSSLRKHTRTHTGEKPFACKMCNYKCSVKSRLKIHTRTHTGEKPFACNLCHYKCSQKSSLEKHTKIHTGEKPFACKLCDYKYSDKSNLKKHIKTHHWRETMCQQNV